MDVGEFQYMADLLNRITSFVAKGHLDLDDVLVLQALQKGEADTPGSLVQQLALSAPAVSRRVGKLRDLDLITEHVSPTDLRKCVLRPTVMCSSVLHEIIRAFPDGEAEQVLAGYRCYVANRSRVRELLGGAGISRTMALVLGALDTAGTPLGISDLSRVTRCPQSSISTAASGLRKRGLIRQPETEQTLPSDGRAVLLELTDHARGVLSLLNGAN